MVSLPRKPRARLRVYKITPRGKLITHLKIVTHLIIKVKGSFICIRCRKKYQLGDRGMTASHYWNSTKWKTRWVFDNIDPMCWGCHNQIEHNKQGWYRDFKLKQLGQERYDELERMAGEIAKWADYELKDMLGLYIIKLLKFNRPDIRYENDTLSIFVNNSWKKLFTNHP